MKRIVFVDVDTQFDFMNPSGALYVKGAEKIISHLKKLTAVADSLEIPIVSSVDTHRKNDPEFKLFPRHCVKATAGQKKISATIAKRTKQIIIAKTTFDMFSNPKADKVLKPFDVAYVYGVALDFCVKAACLGLLKRRKQTYLVINATKAVSEEGKEKTLAMLRKKGIKFISTNQLINRLLKCRKKPAN
ncbi:MAG: isochorismatase family protein [Candidatus Omnitrophica bacterium]|nr:isochorismatase family protein [Candidatus Omnitrophota bacterium]